MSIILIVPMIYFFSTLKRLHFLSCSSIYVIYINTIFLFVYPEKEKHFLYVLTCIFAGYIGMIIAGEYKVKTFKISLIWILLSSILILLFFIFLIDSIFNFNIASITGGYMHENRENARLTYIEYMFSRTLFIFPAVYMIVALKNYFLRAIVIICAMIVSLQSYQKSPTFFFLLSLVIWKFVSKNAIDELKLIELARRIFSSFFLIISLAVAVSWFHYRSDLFITFNIIIERIFILPADISYSALNLLDEYDPFLGGASFSSVFKALELPNIALGAKNFINYYGFSLQSGSANSPAITSIYGDFRFFGAVIFGMVAFILRVYDNTMIKEIQHSDPERRRYITAFYAVTIVLTMKLNITALGTALLSEGFVMALILAYLFACGRTLRVRWR